MQIVSEKPILICHYGVEIILVFWKGVFFFFLYNNVLFPHIEKKKIP